MKFTGTTAAVARKLDKNDPLKCFRGRFFIADENTIYLDGNSLGRLPLPTGEHIQRVLGQQWGANLIKSWNEHWLKKAEQLGARIAQIIGAKANEVLVSDSTSVNLFKLVSAALKKNAAKSKIVSDEFNFPSDLYIIQGVVDLLGNRHELALLRSADGIHIEIAAVKKLVDENTALLTLSHVAFKNAFMYDMCRVNEIAHQQGALVLWDLSHAVGAVPVALNESGADLAVGCTYKYMNGGPGAPAFLYVREELQEELLSPIWGWFGSAEPFAFHSDYKPAPGINRFAAGTPPVLSQAALEPAIDLIHEAGMDSIRAKSIQQSEYLIYLFTEWLAPLGFTMASPLEAKRRGSHVAVKHFEAYRICRALIAGGKSAATVIPDFRMPDIIRLGIAPLYNSYMDIYTALRRLQEIVVNREYELHGFAKDPVT